MGFAAIDEQMEAALRRGVFPGAVLLVRDRGEVCYLRAFGQRALEPEALPMREDTVFDLSSLTKALAVSVALMRLVAAHELGLEDRIVRFFPRSAVRDKDEITLRHLLSHSSGLPAWRPYYERLRQIERDEDRAGLVGSREARRYVYDLVLREKREAAAGERAIYSDLGFILLGAIVEKVSGTSLDRFCAEEIFAPLGLSTATFFDLSVPPDRRQRAGNVAATERCPWRGEVLCGKVHDDNAYAMGGVAGHAGMFAAVRDVDALLCRLHECHRGMDDFVPAPVVREFWRCDGRIAGSTWALGWDGPSPQGSMAGRYFSPHTVGHLGFTGTSFWLDLERDRHVILLSNRVHPRRDNDLIRELRPQIHDAINEVLGV